MNDDAIEQLLQKLCAGDSQAAEQVFVKYEPYLRVVVRRMLPAKLRAKFDSVDVVHSIWADLLDGLRNAGWTFKDADHLRAFLVKATRNRFLDRVRRHQKAADREQSLDGIGADLASQDNNRPSQLAQAEELWREILSGCLPEQRPVLEYKHQGHSIQEIARLTGYHPSSVRRILYDAAARWSAGQNSPGGGNNGTEASDGGPGTN